MNLIGQIEAALNTDSILLQPLVEAQAALVEAQNEVGTTTVALADAQAALDTATENGDDTTEFQSAVDDAQELKDLADAAVLVATTNVANAQAEYETGDLMVLIGKLKATDYNMISNDTLRLILAAQGKEVLFSEPENIISNSAMELVTPSENDVTPVGK
jgi:hypothetical protein